MRKLTIGFSLFAALLMTMTSALVAEILPRNIVVQQSNSPIRIVSYKAAYKPETGLRHVIQYQNRSGQKIVAIRFGMLSFDLFHKFLGKTTGTNVQDMESRQVRRRLLVDRLAARRGVPCRHRLG